LLGLHTRLFPTSSTNLSITTKTCQLFFFANHFNLYTNHRDFLTTQHLQHAELRCPRSPHDWPRLLQLYVFFTLGLEHTALRNDLSNR
jgi:hypothetical protein